MRRKPPLKILSDPCELQRSHKRTAWVKTKTPIGSQLSNSNMWHEYGKTGRGTILITEQGLGGLAHTSGSAIKSA